MTTPTADIVLQLTSRADGDGDGAFSADESLLEAPGSKPNLLPAKASQILSTSATNPDIKEALEVFTLNFEHNNADSRRRLRAQVLQDLATSSTRIISDFDSIAMQVRDIGDALRVMDEAFVDIANRVDIAGTETSPAIQESDTMMIERLRVNRKEILLQAFLNKFTIPAADLANITSSPEALNDDFFETLSRVKRIYSDCQILLSSESTRAGVEIMDHMTKNLNSAYQRLYLWLNRELKTLSFDTPSGSRNLQKGLEVLTGRPTLFQSCIDTLAEARQRQLSESFNRALTGGDGEMDMKPIDMMAHDPIRYIGDMLAWVHSTLVGELEALQAIFEISPDQEASSNLVVTGLEIITDGDLRLRDHSLPLADKSLESVISTLRLRIEQILSSHEEPILLYGMLNVLTFYCETFKRLLGPHAMLVSITNSLVSSATRQLQNCLRDLVREVQHSLPTTTPDLSPPKFLLDALARLKELINNFEISLIPESDKLKAFDMIYSEALQPYLQGCQTLSKDLPSPASDIFMVNCLEVAKNTLRLSKYGDEHYLHLLDDIVSNHVGSIIMYLHDDLLETSGLSKFLLADGDSENDTKDLQNLSSISPENIAECSQQLDDFLPSAMMDAETQLIHLSRPSLKKGILRAALDKFVDDFTRIEIALSQLPNDRFSRELFPRTTQEIQILLS